MSVECDSRLGSREDALGVPGSFMDLVPADDAVNGGTRHYMLTQPGVYADATVTGWVEYTTPDPDAFLPQGKNAVTMLVEFAMATELSTGCRTPLSGADALGMYEAVIGRLC